MKVIVYAISKNEEKFVNRWCDSMSEADSIYVLDTGSSDKTVELLKERGVNVLVKEVKPWRFDVARNLSLDTVPEDADICVCTDLDEVFVPGWRAELEKVWNTGVNRLRYIYNWKLEYDKPVISFYGEKIHSRKNFKWVNPVHEILFYELGKENVLVTDNVTLNHYPDLNKSRGGYLSLLELSVKENPNNDRNMHYLGREYMYYSRWNDCIDTLIKHLKLPNATWKDERSASMRFISRSYIKLGRYDEAKMWLDKAINETPYLREPYVELAFFEYQLGNYINAIDNCLKALSIKEKKRSYITEEYCWNNTIDDLLCVLYYNLGLYAEALFYVNRALKYNPDDIRLIENRQYLLNKNNKE